MNLTITTNFPDVQRKLDAMRQDIADKATARALNKTTAQAQTEMSRQIRKVYNLSAAKVKEKLFTKRASFKAGALGLQAELFSRDKSGKRRAINVINFGARMTGKGLSVAIKRGGRVRLPFGFIGNKGRTAFKRTGPKRLPIAPLQTIDVPQMFNTKRVNAAVLAMIQGKFPAIFEREAAFVLRQFGG